MEIKAIHVVLKPFIAEMAQLASLRTKSIAAIHHLYNI